jgi:5-methylcytosine-specific restriction endonuclease McrA
MKKKRIVNRELLNTYHESQCEICGRVGDSVAHHIKTVGSGGSDIEQNLVSLCSRHHERWHKVATNAMIEKWPHVREILTGKGWMQVEESGKWFLNCDFFKELE